MNSIEQVKNSILDLLFLMQNLSPGQIQGLCQFVNPKGWVDINVSYMVPLVRDVSSERLDDLVGHATKNFPGQDAQQLSEKTMGEKSETEQFTQLYHLVLLQRVLRDTSQAQLMLIFQILDPSQQHQVQQLSLLEHVQKLLNQLEQETLVSLQSELASISKEQPGHEAEELHKLVQLPPEWFHLYEPLRHLLQLPIEELLSFQNFFPQLDSIQKILLLRLMDVGMYTTLDLINVLVPEKHASLVPSIDDDDESTTSSLTIEVIEQPPEKCVYKRNVKPAPTIMITGSQAENDGNLYVAPVLVRCDTNEEVVALLNGGQPVRITLGTTLAFKKLKILQTSHRLNETLFTLKFELRKYHDNEKFSVVHSVTTNPVCVVSHSTQLKAPPKTLPMVTEVIPFCGPPSGKTRVAILGSNFVDSPTTRVKFDNTEVMPIFHGGKTLICHTPAHAPGTVMVRVCNDLNRWSETAGSYTYDDNPKTEEEQGVNVHHEFNFSNLMTEKPDLSNSGRNSDSSSSSFGNAGNSGFFGGGHDFFSDINGTGFSASGVLSLDANGYGLAHYMATYGDINRLGSLLSQIGAKVLFQQDKNGNTPLHWAVYYSQTSAVEFLINSSSSLHFIPNHKGEIPLHWAAKMGNLEMCKCLIESHGGAGATTVEYQDAQGLYPFHLAIAEGHLAVVKYFMTLWSGLSVPSTPSSPSTHESLTLAWSPFLWKGIEGLDGMTPLHLAVATNQLEVLQTLLYPLCQTQSSAAQDGVRPQNPMLAKFLQIRDHEGDTCLHWAVREDNLSIIKLLIKFGAHQIQNHNKESPVGLAISLNHHHLIPYLIPSSATSTPQSVSSSRRSPVKSQARPLVPLNTWHKIGTAPSIDDKRKNLHPSKNKKENLIFRMQQDGTEIKNAAPREMDFSQAHFQMPLLNAVN